MTIARFDIFTAELNEGKKQSNFHGPMRDKQREEFKELLRKNIVTFRFQKRDHTIRKAVGTLYPDYLPEVKGTGAPKPIYQMVYYDLDKKEWRSFRSFKFIKVLKIKSIEDESETKEKPKKKHKPEKGYHVVSKEEKEEREHKKTYKKGDKIPEKELERRSQGYLKHKKKVEKDKKDKKEKSED